MEVERVTVRVEIAGVSVEATAVLDFREGRTKEDAAAAAYNLSRALHDSLEAGGGSAAVLPDWEDIRGGGGQPTSFPAAAPVAQGRFCQINGQELKQYSNAKGSWWSHKHDGEWCKGS